MFVPRFLGYLDLHRANPAQDRSTLFSYPVVIIARDPVASCDTSANQVFEWYSDWIQTEPWMAQLERDPHEEGDTHPEEIKRNTPSQTNTIDTMSELFVKSVVAFPFRITRKQAKV